MRTLLLAGLALACSRKLPSALSPDAPTEAAPTPVQAVDIPSAARALVGSDPLLRRPRVTADWAALEGGAPIAEWADLASRPGASPGDWFALERRWPGTLAVPLARGSRLAALETMVGGDLRSEQEAQVAGMLAPLDDLDRTGPSDIRAPLAWVPTAGATRSRAEAVLHLAERAVLLGWLDGPGLPLDAPATAMVPGIHDRLIDSPAGALLLARSAGHQDDAQAAAGRADLQRATTLALAQAAADRDQEQLDLKLRLQAEADALRAEGDDPGDTRDAALRFLLRRSVQRLQADAARDASTGLALVAMTAERVHGSCPDQPCGGLDRNQTLRRAATWHPDAAPVAAAWQVIAAKKAVDTLEVTRDRPNYGAGAVDLVDLLLGTRAQTADLSLLRQRAPGPETWLAITRAAGAPDATDDEAGIAALRRLLGQLCDAALQAGLDDEQRALVERIARRAAQPVPPPPTPPPDIPDR